jgi:hypothetical protein
VFRYLKRLLRAVTVSGLGFGGGVGMLVFILLVMTHGNKASAGYALKAAIFIGLVFAVLMVVVMLLFDITVKLYLAKGFSEDIWELEQSREIELDGTFRQVAAASRQALMQVPDAGNVSDDSENQVGRASTGASWRSPGEEIEVEINPINETKWRLRCTSKPKSPKVVFDYGKNFENVEVWRRLIVSEMEAAIKPKT